MIRHTPSHKTGIPESLKIPPPFPLLGIRTFLASATWPASLFVYGTLFPPSASAFVFSSQGTATLLHSLASFKGITLFNTFRSSRTPPLALSFPFA